MQAELSSQDAHRPPQSFPTPQNLARICLLIPVDEQGLADATTDPLKPLNSRELKSPRFLTLHGSLLSPHTTPLLPFHKLKPQVEGTIVEGARGYSF